MEDALSILALFVYIALILGLSMGVTWAVVKISPSESAKERRRAKQQSAG